MIALLEKLGKVRGHARSFDVLLDKVYMYESSRVQLFTQPAGSPSWHGS